MKKLALPLAVAFMSLGSSALAQHVLPEQFGKWSKGDCAAKPPASVFFEEAGDRQGAVSCTYTSGSQRVVVWVEAFRDPSAAYQVYTASIRPNMNPSTLGPLTAVTNDELTAQIGNRAVRISNHRAASLSDLKLLLSSIGEGADHTPLPPIRAYLPEERLIQGTQRYALGPLGFAAALDSLNESKYSALTPEIGFATGAEAILARYQVAPNKSQELLIIDYPTPQIAEQHLRHIQSALASNPALAGTNVERKASLLSLVLSPVSEQSAAKLREAINYQTQVTWNEASQTLTDPPWLVVVKDIFVGTLAFCGIAIVVGVAFGGVRVLTKRLFPGKVFDRPEDMEVLQLGLSGKRIDPRDFY
jgi:hypothetical protein